MRMKNFRDIADIVAAVALHVFVYFLEFPQEVVFRFSPKKTSMAFQIKPALFSAYNDCTRSL